GDEADRHDGEVSADVIVASDDAVPAHRRPIAFDTTDGARMKFPNERSLAEWLAIMRRLGIRKSTNSEEPTMSIDLSAIVKSYGILALAKHLASEGKSFGISESELTKLATEDAQRRFPTDRSDVAFAKLYSSEEGASLRSAIEIAKNVSFTADAEALKDSEAACAELAKIGAERWPSLSKSAQFARAFETNHELAKRAMRRPSMFSTTS